MKAELADKSQYIRTMAKDMAALTNAGKTAPAAAPTPAPKKHTETVSGVTTEVPEPRGTTLEAKVTEPGAAQPIPEAPPIPLEPVTSAPAAPAMPLPNAPAEEDRETVLARLRKKVADRQKESVAAAAPSAPVPAPEAAPGWQNIPAPAPQFAPPAEPAPAPLPPVQKETYREPIEEAPAARPAGASGLRTYTGDFANRIDDRGASTFSVLAAEQDAAATAPTPPAPRDSGSSRRTLVAIGSGIALLALAAGGIYATYALVMTMRDTPIATLGVPSIVTADEYRELSGTGSSLMNAFAALAGGAVVPGNVVVAYVMASQAGDDGALMDAPAGGASFLRALQVPAPDILLRNVTEESTVGVVNAGGETRAFFALRVDSYERTYAGMLTWEPLMARDLGPLYPLRDPALPAAEEQVASSTATSTEPVATSTEAASLPAQATALTRFADAVVENRNVRVLRDTDGRSLILYGYADKRTLVIVRDETAFRAILERLK
jgi:hypothetical protein